MPETFSIPWRDVVTLGVYLAGMVAFAIRVKSRLDFLETSTAREFASLEKSNDGRFAELRRLTEGLVERFSRKIERMAQAIEDSNKKLEQVLQEHRAHAERLRSHERDIDRHQGEISALEKTVHGVAGGGVRGDPDRRG